MTIIHLVFMLPTLKKLESILVSACVFSVCLNQLFVRDIILKCHVLIPHGKIVDVNFFAKLSPLALWSLEKIRMKLCKCYISKSILARGLKLGQLTGDGYLNIWRNLEKKSRYFRCYCPFFNFGHCKCDISERIKARRLIPFPMIEYNEKII